MNVQVNHVKMVQHASMETEPTIFSVIALLVGPAQNAKLVNSM